ncbi:probable membrane-associated kinase regulator 4 [Sesamum indicum]|uniref:Probable membrane-associated kinase regulator 4 n=1 Tax=Sesamum indicum TaxID=4182 RepID=A0A6I9UAL5_SESIN|nr:probable membrane-associated kinase regulator 4 [Sesamum indicum]
MAKNLSLHDFADEEDYIDMELTSSPSTTLCCSSNSSPQSREFEFQMSLTCGEKETTTFPADELFYKGKLLPLHLPPRRLMVENLLLQSSTTTFDITKEPFEEDQCYYSMPFPTCSTAPCTNTLNTPSDSCNISPSESCRVSSELNPDDYFFEWSTELSSFINNHPTKQSWSRKLKLIKHSILGQKLKASRAYLKSLFSKSNCSHESSAKANCNAGAQNLPKPEEASASNKYFKISREKPFGRAPYPTTVGTTMSNIDKEDNVRRRSFSSAIKQHSPTKCLSSSSSNSSSGASSSSSSFSLNSNGFHELHFLRRSSSATEIEGSIEAAIAHCKKSYQQILDSRNSPREPGICSFSPSRIHCR